MSRLPITEKQVKEILQNRSNMIAAIHTRMEYITKDIVQTDDIINAVSLRSKRLSDLPTGKGGHQDIHKAFENYKALLHRRDREYAEAIESLISQEECIERVWISFNALETEEFTILNQLYVKNQLYAVVEKESELTHPIFEKKRKSAIRNIIRLYNSDLEDKYIFEIIESNRNCVSKLDSNAETDNYQLSIADMIGDV